MNVAAILRSARHQFTTRGSIGVFRMLWMRGYIRSQEWRYGVHTEAVVTREELGFGTSEFHEYAASDWRYLNKILTRLHLDYGSDVFVDYGAGMGRALIVASGLPFKRVIGVEISPQLALIAEENIKNASRKLACADIRVINIDATAFTIEPEMSIFYFFNSFHGQTLEVVLDAIRASIAANPRLVRVICQLPSESEFELQIQQTPWLRKHDELRLKDGRKLLVFGSEMPLS